MVCTAPFCSAATVRIEFTGLNLEYDGTNIFDSDPISGEDPDPLTSVAISVDNLLQGSVLTDSLAIDIFIPGVSGLPSAGSPPAATSAPGGIWNLDLGPAGFISLDLDTVEVTYANLGGTVQFALGASINANVSSQSLPFGLQIDDMVNVSFSTQVTSFTEVVQEPFPIITSFTSAGTGEIEGPLGVPEPSSLALGLAGLLGLAVARLGRRRRRY